LVSFPGFAALALVAACGRSAVTETAGVSGIALTPPSATMVVGGTLALDAQVQGSASPVDVFWSSSDTTIAVVATSGVVTARRAGRVSIAATALGNSAVAAIVVNNPPIIPPVLPQVPQAPAAVATITVSVADVIETDKTAQALATLRSASGATLTGRSVTWSSSNNSLATVSASGLVTGKKQGTVTITATSEGKQGSKTITIEKH